MDLDGCIVKRKIKDDNFVRRSWSAGICKGKIFVLVFWWSKTAGPKTPRMLGETMAVFPYNTLASCKERPTSHIINFFQTRKLHQCKWCCHVYHHLEAVFAWCLFEYNWILKFIHAYIVILVRKALCSIFCSAKSNSYFNRVWEIWYFKTLDQLYHIFISMLLTLFFPVFQSRGSGGHSSVISGTSNFLFIAWYRLNCVEIWNLLRKTVSLEILGRFLLLVYSESSFQDEDFEYCLWLSTVHGSKAYIQPYDFTKVCKAAKKPKEVGQVIVSKRTLGKVKKHFF